MAEDKNPQQQPGQDGGFLMDMVAYAKPAYNPSMNLILARLENVRPSANGWTARCPAHDDNNPSLSIREAEDGKILIRCWAGCPTEAVMTALGLSMRDLFPAGTSTPVRRQTKAERQEAARRQVEAALERRFRQSEAIVGRELAALICDTCTALERGGWEAIFNDGPGAEIFTSLAHRIDYWRYLADALMERDPDVKVAVLPVAAREVKTWGTLARVYSRK